MSKRARPDSTWTEGDNATDGTRDNAVCDAEEVESFTATSSTAPRRSSRRSYRPQGGRRKGTACVRCRIHKIRCDDAEPACGSCVKAGHSCLRARGNPELDNYVQELELKVKHLERELEQARSRASPLGSLEGLVVAETISPASEQINPSEPLAHNVGLLSLANSREPKYLGPSSGVVFGRLVFAAAPATQGLPTSLAEHTTRRQKSRARTGECDSNGQKQQQQPPSTAELLHFIDAYFEIYQPLYPFLDPVIIFDAVEHISSSGTDIDLTTTSTAEAYETFGTAAAFQHVQALLVSALGARALESRLRTDFGAEALYSRAVERLAHMPMVLETVRGVQVLLLLALASFSFPGGYNAWYLTSTIIASCLDLGLQRRSIGGSEGGSRARDKHPPAQYRRNDAGLTDQEVGTSSGVEMSDSTLRSSIFWSAYSLDRTLCVVLGRPLTLRDEALDADFPDGSRSHDDDAAVTGSTASSISSISPQILSCANTTAQTPANEHDEEERPAKRMNMTVKDRPYAAACYSFRYDQIISEIKLMLHRVSQAPRRFPWPTAADLPRWQAEIQDACEHLLAEIQTTFQGPQQRQRQREGASFLSVLQTRHGSRGSTAMTAHERTIQTLELKHHACIALLHRPSPAIPRPTRASMRRCYESSRATIAIYAAMHRFGNLPGTWLAAHAVFVAGITMLYCLWTMGHRAVDGEDGGGVGEDDGNVNNKGFEAIRKDCESCTRLLKVLGETWSVAEDAMARFERLVQLTERTWDNGGGGTNMSSAGPVETEGRAQQGTRYQQPGRLIAAAAYGAPAVELDPSTGSQQANAFCSDTGVGGGDGGGEGGGEFPDLFMDELGDMSTWFDLSWLDETEVFPLYPA